MSHFPVRLERPRGAMALLALEPETAVIFVHGFLGDPRATWIDFQNLVDDLDEQRPIWSKCDLFFYHYRSKEQIGPLAEDFYNFLKADYRLVSYASILPSSLRVSSRVGRRVARYKSLVLVGHSAGAVIIRDVVLQNLKGSELQEKLSSWQPLQTPSDDLERLIPQAELRLFAPAHLGVLGAGILGVAQSVRYLDKILEAYLRWNSLYQNLRSKSATLVNLQRETEALLSKYPAIKALKASMLFGQQEYVVEVGGYSQDEFYGATPGHKHFEPNQNHVTVCKPCGSYRRPIEFVAQTFKQTRAANE
jgi:hypothetical protein